MRVDVRGVVTPRRHATNDKTPSGSTADADFLFSDHGNRRRKWCQTDFRDSGQKGPVSGTGARISGSSFRTLFTLALTARPSQGTTRGSRISSRSCGGAEIGSSQFVHWQNCSYCRVSNCGHSSPRLLTTMSYASDLGQAHYHENRHNAPEHPSTSGGKRKVRERGPLRAPSKARCQCQTARRQGCWDRTLRRVEESPGRRRSLLGTQSVMHPARG